MLPASEPLDFHRSTVPALTSSSTRGFSDMFLTISFCREGEEAEVSLESKFVGRFSSSVPCCSAWVSASTSQTLVSLVSHFFSCPWPSACTSRSETAIRLQGQVKSSCLLTKLTTRLGATCTSSLWAPNGFPTKECHFQTRFIGKECSETHDTSRQHKYP